MNKKRNLIQSNYGKKIHMSFNNNHTEPVCGTTIKTSSKVFGKIPKSDLCKHCFWLGNYDMKYHNIDMTNKEIV